MRILPTGSKFHRIWRCPPSAILPQIESDEPSPAADRGKAIHAFLERVRLIGFDAALAECPEPELMPLLKAIDIEELPTHLATEVSFAYDWKNRTARELGRNLGRQYVGIAPTEIPFTIDLVGGQTFAGIRRGYAGDYKSGHGKFPPPDRFGQTMLAALGVRIVYQCTEMVLELIHIHDSGDHHKVRRRVDEWEMDTFADEVEATMELVDYSEREYLAGRGVPAREGPHCDWCPAYKQCPAKVALVRAIPREMAQIPAAGEITRVQAADLWMATERITEVLSRVREEICGLAAYGEIELPDGRVIGRLVTDREGLDGKIAAEVLEQWHGIDARNEAVEISVSKDALRKAVVARKKAGEKISTVRQDGIFDLILAEIRRRGGAVTSHTESIKPHVPKKRQRALPEP